MTEGVINVYKERGFTSHDVVARLRGILRMKRIGHTGTLDPDAEGVLPVCLGHATRLCDMLTDETKVYRAVMLLGVETDTQDITGQVVQQLPVQVTEEQVTEVINGFLGGYDQIPPMYSALKVDGKKLYQLARQGRTVERKPRRVNIRSIEVDRMELPRVTMTVECSKGTYIRTLCHDIGKRLGCGACMEKLLRVRVGRFCLEDALTLGQIEELRDAGELEGRIVRIEEMFDGLPGARAVPEADRLAHNGNPLKLSQVKLEAKAKDEPGDRAEDEPEDRAKDEPGDRAEDEPEDRAKDRPKIGTAGEESGREGRFRLYDSQGCFIGIYRLERAEKRLKPEKMFIATEASG